MGLRTKRKTIAIALIFMILTYVLFASGRVRLNIDYGDEDGDMDRPYEVEYRNLKLASSQREVPVIIVDQHQEVIPYWYKAVEEKLIPPTQNTVVHIDAHSDMALPFYNKQLKKFDPNNVKKERHFLPMMQSNDVFLYSAILKGFINRVIWVKPDWSKDQKTYYTKGFVGLMKRRGSSNEIVCFCEQKVVNDHARDRLRCVYSTLTQDISRLKPIPFKSCRKVYPYKYIEISESNFVQDIRFKKKINLFIDIDEDFFGVESGIENFLLKGVSMETQKVLDAILPRLYAPDSFKEEIVLNEKIRRIFAKVTVILVSSKEQKIDKSTPSLRKKVRDVIESTTGKFLLDERLVHEFVIFLLTLSPKEATCLSRARFCSLRSSRFARNGLGGEFSLCHGSLYPKDGHVKEYFVGSEKAIEKRGDSLISIFHHIHQNTSPKFYTLARSLRDGYVPRDQQRLIENVLLRSIDQTEISMNRYRKTIYDPLLVFGKKGWSEDS